MKTLFYCVFFFISSAALAQKVGFTYQAVAVDQSRVEGLGHDSGGEILVNTPVALRFSIREASLDGPVKYEERHDTATDIFGIFRVVVGRGYDVSGILDDLSWGEVIYFLQIEIDLGSGFELLGTEELLGSPYALNKKIQNLHLENNLLSISDGNAITLSDNDNTNELITDFRLDDLLLSITDAGGTKVVDLRNIVSAPLTEADVDNYVSDNGFLTSEIDGSVTNEIQDLTLNANILSITSNASAAQIDLSPYLDNTNLSESEVDAFVNNNGYLTTEAQTLTTDGSAGNISISNGETLNLNVDDADANPTNEIQDLQLNGTVLTITNNSNATPIDFADFINNIALTEGQVDEFTDNNGYLTSEVDGSVTNEIQDLSLTNNILTITNNASATAIDLSAYENVFETTNNVTSNENGNYATDDFVFGSPSLNDDDDAAHASRLFFSKNRSAFRAGYSQSLAWDESLFPLGEFSLGIGYMPIATGTAAVALGYSTGATGNNSFAAGNQSIASADGAVAIGANNTASGQGSLALGNGNAVGAVNSFGIGNSNQIQNTAQNAFALGSNSMVSGSYGVAVGHAATASGEESTAIGLQAGASALRSMAFGYYSSASGTEAVSLGSQTDASGFRSTALGFATVSSGQDSRALGTGVQSPSYGEAALGLWNTSYQPIQNGLLYNSGDRLFSIGNGQNTNNRSDAFIVLKNGNARLHGQFTIDADNVNGPGESYTLPGQDGNANQILSTDGNGNVSWTNPVSALAEEDVDDFVSDNGYLTSEVDGSVSNEIQDLTFTNDVLTITNNASATAIDLSAYENVFETTNNVTSNENGNYATDDFVFGSPTLENNGDVNHRRRILFDKSKGAFRAGSASGTEWDDVNRGSSSFAAGTNTRASGGASFAVGSSTVAGGSMSFASGWGSIANGDRSSSLGFYTQANGHSSIAAGSETVASGNASFAFGHHSIAAGIDAVALGEYTQALGDRSFAFGVQSDAIGVNSFAIGNTSVADDENSIAVGYQTTSSGYGSMALGYMTNSSATASFGLGYNTTASGHFAVAINGTASANNSVAIAGTADAASAIAIGGLASGQASLAMNGGGTTANAFGAFAVRGIARGPFSMAMGQLSETYGGSVNGVAIGWGAVSALGSAMALGTFTTASGDASSTLGFGLFARSYGETVVGSYNTDYTPADPPGLEHGASYFLSTDRIFTVGNGTSLVRSDAFIVLKNGNTRLHGQFTIDADNVNGPGESYTLPGQDGNANQVLSTDGNGNVSWTTPAGGTVTEADVDGFVSNNGYLTSEVDGSVTNEIQDLNLTNDVLTITNNASATAIDLSAYENVFETTNNVTSNENGDYATDDFVFGSPLLASPGYEIHNSRFFFDKSKAAFRVGYAWGDTWADANVGEYSLGTGLQARASGMHSVALGSYSNATGVGGFAAAGGLAYEDYAIAIGQGVAQGVNAIALGYAANAGGDRSVAFHYGEAFGDYSWAFGNVARAYGTYSIGWGEGAHASGNGAVAIGGNVRASGLYSYALGSQLYSRSMNETVVGTYNTDYVPLNASGFNVNDRLFVIGNGTHSLLPSDAFIMLKNGNTRLHGQFTIDADNVNGAGESYTLPGQDGNANQILSTDGNGNVSWINAAAELTETEVDNFVSNNGYLTSEVDASVTNEIQDLALANDILTVTNNASATEIDLAPYVNAFSTTDNITSNENGDYATDNFVFGSPQLDDDGDATHNTRMFFDKGNGAFRAGTIEGDLWDPANRGAYSTAFGDGSVARGQFSFAVGNDNLAHSASSVAIGTNTTALGYNAFAIGRDVISSGAHSMTFGFYSAARSFGETVLGLHATDYLPNSANNFHLADRLLTVGNGQAGATSDALVIYKNGDATLLGTLTEASDARLKKDVVSLHDSFGKISTLKGVNYRWNGVKSQDTLDLQTGFIAQQVEQVFPELVKEDAQGYKSVNYIGLIPHLVEAIKVLKEENAQLKKQNDDIKRDSQNSTLSLEQRLSALEALLTTKASNEQK